MVFVGILEILIAFICFVFLGCLKNSTDGQPINFPLVWMMPQLLLNVHRIHDWCTEILQMCHCTALFIGPCMNFLLTCHPANVHYVMISNFHNFPKGSDFKEIFEILGDGIFNADMDLWKYQRKVAQEFVRHQRFHRMLSTTSPAKVENGIIPVLEHVAKRGLVVNLEDVLQRFTFDSTFILFTGNDPESHSVDFPEVHFSKALDDAEEALFYRLARPQSFIKLQKWLNMGQEHKYRKAWEVLDDVIVKCINQRRKELNQGLTKEADQVEGVDLLTSYITQEKATGLKCNDKFLRDTILNLMIAGRDTTSSALTWFIWLVSRHPKVEKKIIEELRSKIPEEETKKRRVLGAEEVKDLVYLHGALCEALRLYPPVPFQLKEPLKADILPSGHPIHPKMKIMFKLYSMGRMKSIWGEDSYEFKPERWITERGGIKYEASTKFLSFNAGPRICVGKKVAFVIMTTVASAIIYNYRINVLEETPVVPAASVILHTKDGLMARVSSRWD